MSGATRPYCRSTISSEVENWWRSWRLCFCDHVEDRIFKLNYLNSPNCFSTNFYKATWKNMELNQDMFNWVVKFGHGEIDCHWNKDWLSPPVLDGVLQSRVACCRPDYFKRCPYTNRKKKSIFEQINNKHFNENNISCERKRFEIDKSNREMEARLWSKVIWKRPTCLQSTWVSGTMICIKVICLTGRLIWVTKKGWKTAAQWTLWCDVFWHKKKTDW